MKTYKIPVTFYIEARSPENAESTLMGALGYLEDNCGLKCYAQPEYNMDETDPETCEFDWGLLQEELR